MLFRVSVATIACALLLALSGCYSYPPYGQGGGGGYYSQPPGRMMAPSNPSLGPSGPTPVFPDGGTAPSGQGWQNPSTPGDGTFKNEAPSIGPGSGAKDFDANKTVPDASNLDTPIGPEINQQKSPSDTTPFGPEGALQRESGESFSNDSDLQFKDPINATPTSSRGQVSATLADAQSPGPSPYKYDAKEYKFLMGVVEYVEEEKTWHLMYSATPDAGDKFGGDIALKDHPSLKGLRKDDVVYVEGHVDSQSHDATGKPTYHVDHLQKFVPKPRM